MQKKKSGFHKYLLVGRPLNLNISPNVEEILETFWEIMGKYSMLHEHLWGIQG